MSHAVPVQHNAGDPAPLMLSVSGARGIVGKTMTPAVAADFAAAFGSHIKSTAKKSPPAVCLGRDSRPSGEALAHAAIAGLASVGCRVIDLGIVTTPTVAVMIGKHKATGGMAITASHNPIEWNGLKCLNADGVAPPPEVAGQIIQRFKSKDFLYAPVTKIPAIERDDSGNETHVARVLANVDVKSIRKARFKVVLDSVNGAGCVAGRMLLEKFGCKVVHINDEPNGLFAHTPEPTEANLKDLARKTKSARAACGFAQDPDADRLAVIDETGRYIGEEYTLVLAAQRILQRKRQTGVIAANLSTSRMIDDITSLFPGVKVLRTAVGEANVVVALKQHGKKAIIGGEGNGGVILPQVCWVRDSLSAMALILELLAATRLRLRDLVDQLPRYVMIKQKYDLKDLGGGGGIDFVRAAMQRIIDHYKNEQVSTIDGVRIDFSDASGNGDSWVHLRPSNTEPIVRLIAEAKTESRVHQLIHEVTNIAGLK